MVINNKITIVNLCCYIFKILKKKKKKKSHVIST